MDSLDPTCAHLTCALCTKYAKSAGNLGQMIFTAFFNSLLIVRWQCSQEDAMAVRLAAAVLSLASWISLTRSNLAIFWLGESTRDGQMKFGIQDSITNPIYLLARDKKR